MKISAINSMYINNRSLQTKSLIRFGESEGYWDGGVEQNPKTISSKDARWQVQKSQIEARYRKQIESLSKTADGSGMNNDVYWNLVRSIQNEKDIALKQARILFEYEN